MNEQIEKWIENRKSEQRKEFEQKRDEHLVNIGLTDESKTIRKYYDYFIEGMQYDEDKGRYYKDSNGPIDVSDEEYAEICKYAPFKEFKQVQMKGLNNGVEGFLNIMAYITLSVGVIAFIVLLASSIDTIRYYTEFSFLTFGYGVCVLISSLVVFAVLRVFRNISLTLKSIDSNFNL